MASIDYQEARKEIEKFFVQKNFGVRKILFWYDPPMNFKEDILNDSLDFCRLLVCDKNEFEIKKISNTTIRCPIFWCIFHQRNRAT